MINMTTVCSWLHHAFRAVKGQLMSIMVVTKLVSVADTRIKHSFSCLCSCTYTGYVFDQAGDDVAIALTQPTPHPCRYSS
jgi:hypothetical protein